MRIITDKDIKDLSAELVGDDRHDRLIFETGARATRAMMKASFRAAMDELSRWNGTGTYSERQTIIIKLKSELL